MPPLLLHGRFAGAAFAAAAVALALLADCSGDDAAAPTKDAGRDSTLTMDAPEEPFDFSFDVMGCPPNVPNGPCNELNQVCPAAAAECEQCVGGFVLRTAQCVCGGFWNCDQCGFCHECDAAVIYMDPACTVPIPVPPDAGNDAPFRFDSGSDAGEGGAVEAGDGGEGGDDAQGGEAGGDAAGE